MLIFILLAVVVMLILSFFKMFHWAFTVLGLAILFYFAWLFYVAMTPYLPLVTKAWNQLWDIFGKAYQDMKPFLDDAGRQLNDQLQRSGR